VDNKNENGIGWEIWIMFECNQGFRDRTGKKPMYIEHRVKCSY